MQAVGEVEVTVGWIRWIVRGMNWVVLHGGTLGSSLRRSESKRPLSRRSCSGSSSGGLNSQD
jgi:hypothetical protein